MAGGKRKKKPEIKQVIILAYFSFNDTNKR